MHKNLSSENEKKIEAYLRSVEKTGSRKVAVFDADGTLWHGDIGEIFFQYQMQKGLLAKMPNPPEQKAGESLWDLYWRYAQSAEAAKAYQWLATWNEGLSEKDLIKQCQDFFNSIWKDKIFLFMKTLMAQLKSHGFEIWVISGSMKWIVAEGASHLGISKNNILGSSVVIKQGILASEPEHEVPYRSGKARLIDLKIKENPIFAAGNTFWDKEMLEKCSGLCLAIHSEKEGEPNFESEQKLRNIALQKNWLIQSGV